MKKVILIEFFILSMTTLLSGVPAEVCNVVLVQREKYLLEKNNNSDSQWKTTLVLVHQNECCDGSCGLLCNDDCNNGICDDYNMCICNDGYERQSDKCVPVEAKTSCDKGFKLVQGRCEPVCFGSCKNGYCSAPNKCECYPGHSPFELASINACNANEDFECKSSFSCNCPEGYSEIYEVPIVCTPECKDACVDGYCGSPGKCFRSTGAGEAGGTGAGGTFKNHNDIIKITLGYLMSTIVLRNIIHS